MAKAVVSATRIEGLRELQRALKAVDGQLHKELRLTFNKVAEKVAGKVRGRMPRRKGTAASTVRAQSTQRAAQVVAGGRKVPYYGPLDFGGYPKGRSFVPEGRYLYPTVEAESPGAVRDIEKGLEDLIRKAGLS
jgi:hypothetical protein